MGSRPLPQRPLPLSCCSCTGKFSIAYDEAGIPTAYHSLPYCAAFEAIATSVDALTHHEKCRAAIDGAERAKDARMKG